VAVGVVILVRIGLSLMPHGTKLLIRDVRCHAAGGGNPDMVRAVHFDSVDTFKNEHQSFAHGLA
jgi:hypothetical protein